MEHGSRAWRIWYWLSDRIDLWRWPRLTRLVFCHPCAPIEDHCGKPEHDFCAWCGRSMPYEAHT